MQQITVMEKYPVFIIKVNKNETVYPNVEAILSYLKNKLRHTLLSPILANLITTVIPKTLK